MESGSVHGPGGATFSAFTHPKQQAGFDESELREFNKALKQNLLVQTPLQVRSHAQRSALLVTWGCKPTPCVLSPPATQVLLETMFARLQSQAQMFHDLHDRVRSTNGHCINCISQTTPGIQDKAGKEAGCVAQQAKHFMAA